MSMNRLDQVFARLKQSNKKALVTYTMAGDPDATTSLELLHKIAQSGADILEIGMPFSDPMADGPEIQAAGIRALNGGMTLQGVLDVVSQFRSINSDTPIVLMGYFNPILRYGIEKFSNDCSKIGVDGLIIADIPPEEENEILPKLQQNNIALIRLIAPTSDETRLDKILKSASGFLYYVSILGITGTTTADADIVAQHIKDIRKKTDLPIVAGFGIKTPEDARAFSAVADGVVVGSTIVRNIKENQSDKRLTDIISTQVKSLRSAV